MVSPLNEVKTAFLGKLSVSKTISGISSYSRLASSFHFTSLFRTNTNPPLLS
jgi:hypothetical protein